MHLFQKTMVLRLLVQSWAFPTGKGMDERSSCTRVCGYLCLCTTAHSTGWTEHCHDNGNNTHIQYTVYRSISGATPMPSGHGSWSKNLGCWIVNHIDVVLLNPWLIWLADHLLSCNIQRQLRQSPGTHFPMMSGYIGVASSWHVAWACMGLIWRYWRWRQRCASLRCTHAVHSETIPWQHLHTPTKKPRNW